MERTWLRVLKPSIPKITTIIGILYGLLFIIIPRPQPSLILSANASPSIINAIFIPITYPFFMFIFSSEGGTNMFYIGPLLIGAIEGYIIGKIIQLFRKKK